MLLLIVAILLFVLGLVAAHDGDEVFGLNALEYICLGLAFFAAAHLPVAAWINQGRSRT